MENANLYMETEKEILKRLERIEALLENHLTSVPCEGTNSDYLTTAQACRVLNRSTSWLMHRIVDADDVTEDMPVQNYFVRGIDVLHEGNRLVFERAAVERMKNVLLEMGRAYYTKVRRQKIQEAS